MLHMKKIAIATGALLAGFALAPTALAHNASNNSTTSQHANATQMWQGMDANHDGYITRGEAEAYNKVIFAQADANGDGRLSQDEFQSARHHGYDGALNPVVKAHNDATQTWNRLDSNADGELTQAEVSNFTTRMFLANDDIDPGRSVDKAEFMSAWNDTGRGHHNTKAVAQLWNQMDADHDGQLSPSEMKSFQHKLFARLDTNGNGKVTQSEYNAALRNPGVDNWAMAVSGESKKHDSM